MPCPDHTRTDPFCDDCLAVEAAEQEPVAWRPIEAVAVCWLCGNAGPSAGGQADGLCERCDKGQAQPRSGQARLQAWLERRGNVGPMPKPPPPAIPIAIPPGLSPNGILTPGIDVKIPTFRLPHPKPPGPAIGLPIPGHGKPKAPPSR